MKFSETDQRNNSSLFKNAAQSSSKVATSIAADKKNGLNTQFTRSAVNPFQIIIVKHNFFYQDIAS